MADRNFKSKSQAGDWQGTEWMTDFGSANGDLGRYSKSDQAKSSRPWSQSREDRSNETRDYEPEIIPPGSMGSMDSPAFETRPTSNDEIEESETRIKFMWLDFGYRWRKTRKSGWE